MPSRRATASNPREYTGRAWGFIAADVQNAPACIASCRKGFLDSLSSVNKTLTYACESISNREAIGEQPLNPLYCCSAQSCGVDHLSEPGQDQFHTNDVSSIGSGPIVDPGPPRADHVCLDTGAQHADTSDVKSIRTTETVVETWARSTYALSQLLTAPAERTSASQPGATPTSAQSTTQQISEPSFSEVHDPSLVSNTHTPNLQDDGPQTTEMSPGIRATIALSTIAGVAIVLALIFCFLRRRRRHSRDSPFRSPKDFNLPPHPESPVLLAAPFVGDTGRSSSPRPPPRLHNRRFLPPRSSAQSSGNGSPLLTEQDPKVSLHSSAASDTHAQRENAVKEAGKVGAAPTALRMAVATPIVPWHRASSLESYASNPTTINTTSPTASIVAWPARADRTGSGSSHQRRHTNFDSPVNSFSLASPGPPPNKALPRTPSPCRSNGPKSPKAATAPRFKFGTTATSSIDSADCHHLSSESRDLCELTEQCAREPRGSWGSWRGNGGGGPGVTVSSPLRETTIGSR
ncbi:hypothetical protein S7711_09368, partial [Stachybotrys chartarum IBT 7711]